MGKIHHAAEECRIKTQEDRDGHERDHHEGSQEEEDPATSRARKRPRYQPSGCSDDLRSLDRCREGVIEAAEGSRPSYSIGGRIDDVAWKPLSEGRLAIAGSSGSGLTLLDLSSASSPSYRKLSLNSNQSRVNKCLWLSKHSDASGGGGGKGHASCLLAVSDRHSIHLFDPRKGNMPASKLTWSEPLATPVESLSGGDLLCAVACGQKLLVWDLRKGGSSLGGGGGGGVRVLGASGPVQHGLLSCQDLSGAITTAARECVSTLTSSSSTTLFGQEICQGQGSGFALLPVLSWVQQVAANPSQPSLLALVMHNTSVAFYDLATASITKIHLAPQLLHSNTRQSLSSLRFLNQGIFRGAWNSNGSRFWSPSLHVRDATHESMALPSPLSNLWFDVGRSDYSGEQALSSILVDPFADPPNGISNFDAEPDRSIRYGAQGAGMFDPRPGHASEYLSVEARLRKKAFKAGGLVGKLAEIAPALQATGADPDKMLIHLTQVAQASRAGSSLIAQAAATALSSMDEGKGSSDAAAELAASVAVSEWEDARRRRCGPSSTLSLTDWPSCFASCQGYGWGGGWTGNEDMLAGLAGGRLGVIRGYSIT